MGGVDLIRKSWDLATGGAPPGITDCTMALDDSLLIASSEAQCFFRPSGEYGNRYHASVGVFNTGGRLPASATLNGISGSFNGDSAYFDFNGVDDDAGEMGKSLQRASVSLFAR